MADDTHEGEHKPDHKTEIYIILGVAGLVLTYLAWRAAKGNSAGQVAAVPVPTSSPTTTPIVTSGGGSSSSGMENSLLQAFLSSEQADAAALSSSQKEAIDIAQTQLQSAQQLTSQLITALMSQHNGSGQSTQQSSGSGGTTQQSSGSGQSTQQSGSGQSTQKKSPTYALPTQTQVGSGFIDLSNPSAPVITGQGTFVHVPNPQAAQALAQSGQQMYLEPVPGDWVPYKVGEQVGYGTPLYVKEGG